MTVLISKRELVECKREWTKPLLLQPVFKLLKLLYERRFDLKLWPSRIQKFQSLDHRPSIFAHQVAGQHRCCPRLTFDGVDKNRLASSRSYLNKVIDLLCSFILAVKKRLCFGILPEKSEVNYSDVLPEVAHLFATAVYDVRDFVCHYEFKILKVWIKNHLLAH